MTRHSRGNGSYTLKVTFVFPGDLDTPTGGYRYDRAIIAQMREMGHEVMLASLAGGYPFPTEEDKAKGLELVSSTRKASIAVVDGLAGGAHPELLERLAVRMPVVSLLHHPLCMETGLTHEECKHLKETEARYPADLNPCAID